MSGTLHRTVRQALTIARRDFTATVFTPVFLLFLVSPVFMIGFGLVGGSGAASLAEGTVTHERIVAIADGSTAEGLRAADAQLRPLFPSDGRPPVLTIEMPQGDPAAQARAAFAGTHSDVSAILYGPLATPTVLYGAQGLADSRYLAGLAEQALQIGRSGSHAALSHPTRTRIARPVASGAGHHQAAFFTAFGIFFLTLLLSGQVVGTMMEERSNKVVEVLAAAAPLEAVFVGKLIGMFGSALLFVAFWGTLASQIGSILPASMATGLGEVGPAIGLPLYALLFFAYFAMAYMLLGAVFLGVGAQASTPRELQMMSLPITVLQVGMFYVATQAAAKPGSGIARFAELFPFSSPYAMAARAANAPELWPHLLGLAYELLWVAIAIAVGAWAFRRGVLQSGGGTKPSLKALLAKR